MPKAKSKPSYGLHKPSGQAYCRVNGRMVDYTGTVLLVSDDREFLNNVVTQTLVFEGNGVVKEYADGYDDWVAQRAAADAGSAAPQRWLRRLRSHRFPGPSIPDRVH